MFVDIPESAVMKDIDKAAMVMRPKRLSTAALHKSLNLGVFRKAPVVGMGLTLDVSFVDTATCHTNKLRPITEYRGTSASHNHRGAFATVGRWSRVCRQGTSWITRQHRPDL